MALETIPVERLQLRPHGLWNDEWFLLTSGDFAAGSYNTMTVSWGALGVLWNRPIAMVVVRPQRYTHLFMERSADFTLCAFPERCHGALELLGSRSGRSGDKIGASGLTACASSTVRSPSFAEAKLVLECRKIYRDALDPAGFLDPSIASNYAARDYHSLYLGEIVEARGSSEYHAS